MQQAPFRFPAAVLTMAAFFLLLLALDWLSLKFPGRPTEDLEGGQASVDEKKLDVAPITSISTKQSDDLKAAISQPPQSPPPPPSQRIHQRKRFLEPVLFLIAAPCEFCLRNMSVMFTPAFILIPARETLPSREIGYIAGWFTATQFLGFVFPVVCCWALDWIVRHAPKGIKFLRLKRQATINKLSAGWSGPTSATLTTTSSTLASRRTSAVTLAGLEYEKGRSFVSGQRLGTVATGLSGLTAVVVAPVSHVNMDPHDELDEDAMSQFEGVAMETSRQQGDPWVRRGRTQKLSATSPRSHVSNFEHRSLARVHSTHSGRARSSSRSRTHQRGVASEQDQKSRSVERPHIKRPASADRPASRDSVKSAPSHSFAPKVRVRPPTAGSTAESMLSSWSFADSANPRSSGEIARPVHPADEIAPDAAVAPAVQDQSQHIAFEDTAHPRRAIRTDGAPQPSGLRSGFTADDISPSNELSASQRTSRLNSAATIVALDLPASQPMRADSISKEDKATPPPQKQSPPEDDEETPNAVQRLADWIADLITPTVYFLVFLVGIPLYFCLDFPLLLFLSVNLLTFLASITIVPPSWRRFLHPILSTSVATVLILWAFGAMKGLTIKETLAQYSYDASRYTDIWNPAGYNGPVPGAGDFLFSTLDAGIVALAIPMYRYRKDLLDNFGRMITVLTPCAALSLFVWPTIARLIGLDVIRSLAFAPRFMSTPLAIELANALRADESITVILVVLTGIVNAILKEPLFKLLRVPDSDFVTWGITMGSTSGAIGASSLISRPRTM